MCHRVAVMCLLVLSLRVGAAPLPPGYHAEVKVAAPTRLDWTFALGNRSFDTPPRDWTPDYVATQQSYELFVPARPDPRQLLGLILYISPGNKPNGRKAFEAVCQGSSLLFAGVANAGNEVPIKKRIRVVMDVLDDLRRNYPVDPDRTYLAGFSGGGRIACAIAFGLPELFGGVIPICAAENLREESWLRQRVIDRLSVAPVTGEKDFNRGEVERYRGPMLRDVGVRVKTWTQPGLGHGLPSDKVLKEVVRWLDEDVERRREQARKYPAARIPSGKAPSREELARALLAEGQQRMKAPETLYSGLMLVKGCMERWPDLAPAEEAKKLLLELEARQERPWEKEDLAEQRRFLIARARALDAYLSGDLPDQYAKMRPQMIEAALQFYQQILGDSPDSEAGQQARKRIPELKKLLKP